MNNQKIGTEFEQDFSDQLFSWGWWVHFMQPSPEGSQPFDIIAIRGNDVMCIDCKTNNGSRFTLSRVEDNQHASFTMLNERGFHRTLFAVKNTKTNIVHIIPYEEICKALARGEKSIKLDRGNEWFTLTTK